MRFLAFFAIVALCRGTPIVNQLPYREVTTLDVESHCLSVEQVWDIDDFMSADPLDCRGFFICVFDLQEDGSKMLSHQAHVWCEPNMRFSEALRVCVPGESCVEDPCTNNIPYYVPDPSENLPCNTFYQCDNQISKLRCCPGDLVFDPLTTTCIESDTCQNALCPLDVQAAPVDVVDLLDDECRLGDFIYRKLEDGHSYAMMHLDRTIPWGLTDLVTQACPEGTMFMGADGDINTCYCAWVGEAPPVVADPLAICKSFTYEPAELPATYVEHVGSVVTPYNDGAAHGLCFGGVDTSYISIPYYNGNDWKSGFSAALRFKYNSWDAHTPASILTNGDADTTPTIDMQVSDTGVQVNLVMMDDTPCSLDLPIVQVMPQLDPVPPPEYMDVTVMFDGQQLIARHGISTVSTTCSGELKSLHEPMVIGANFAGCIDDLHICKGFVDPYAAVNPLK